MDNKDFVIDNITWNDLNLEEIYNRINICESSVGAEYLKQVLKSPVFDLDLLKSRNERIRFFQSDASSVKKLRRIFKNLGKTKKVSFLDYIFRLEEAPTGNNLVHFVLGILLIISIILIFISPVAGILGIVVMIAVNIATYFRFKASVEGYFNCVKYLVSMVITARAVLKSNLLPEAVFLNEISDLSVSVKIFASVQRGSWLITNSVSGSLIDVLMDYVRMIFHVDIIKFNNMRKTVINHPGQVRILYNTLGEIEASLCMAEYRNGLGFYCEPDISFKEPLEGFELELEDLYHPLIENPVCNSVKTNKSMLLSGSNASGKSTFLKAVAINQIFAQTVYTCFTRKTHTCFAKVLSSMALNDSILNNESYFIVEIKSLKRIFGEAGVMPVMCFIDEVLRGTNTIERIAASGSILESLSAKNCLVFAATHDIELTALLSGYMVNYHFSEIVEQDDVIFDYRLKSGHANTSNAIKLLKAFDFEPSIVERSAKRAENFRSTGMWK